MANAIDMTKIYKNYKGKWIAMKNYETKPEVIVAGKTLREVLLKAKAKGFEDPVVTQIPKELTYFVGIIIIK